jgi:creatinine amidohydrolase
MALHRRRLAELRYPQVSELLSEQSILVQPIGAIEQHGPHLPLDTDLVIATDVAEATVAERGDEVDAWLLPPLAYSKSDEHAWAPGTVWLSASTFLAVLDDLGRCAAMTPARRLVLFNGHGGNSALLGVALRELRRHHGLLTFLAHPTVPPDQGGASPVEELGMGIHGGTDETSLMLHLRPERVVLDDIARTVPEGLAANRHVRFGGAVSFGWLSNDFGPGGYIGDPTAASAERGKQLFEGAVRAFGDALTEVASFDLPM